MALGAAMSHISATVIAAAVRNQAQTKAAAKETKRSSEYVLSSASGSINFSRDPSMTIGASSINRVSAESVTIHINICKKANEFQRKTF